MASFPKALDVSAGQTLLLEDRFALLSLKQAKSDDGAFHPVVPWPTLFDRLTRIGLRIEGGPDGMAGPGPRIHHTENRLWVRDAQGKPMDARYLSRIRRSLGDRLDWIGPVYRAPNTVTAQGAECPLPHVVIVRPLAHVTGEFDAIPEALAEMGLVEVPGKSRFLGRSRYFEIEDRKRTAYELRDRILKKLPHLVGEVLFEYMPMASPEAFEPDDTWFDSQWNLERIAAAAAWDIAPGAPGVTVAVIDSGCEQPHPDLVYSPNGLNLETMSGNGSPLLWPSGSPKVHGTHTTGVAAAVLNTIGIAGVGGGCTVLPLASTYTDMEVAAGIRYALSEGARVINMSFVSRYSTFWGGEIPRAIEEAERAGCVLCASSGNGDSATLGRPAEHPFVMAVGASDMADGRWRAPAIGDGSSWGDSVVGGEAVGVSVVAPGERIWTTDFTGGAGSTGFDYTDVYTATSASCPHVAGVAALLLSAYPTLSPEDIRSVIERTAEKVGPLPYVDVAGYPNGTRNPEFGYGRLNAFRALDLADVMIRDWSGDSGVEPSTPPGGVFYAYSDIVVRPEDDEVFMPDVAASSSQVVRSQVNYIYVRVHNRGPAVARNVTVEVRISPWTGIEFVYPADWTRSDDTHVAPTAILAAFATLPVGADVIAKFSLSVAQVESLWDWTGRGQHPCLLAQVNSENDYAFGGETLAGSDLIVRRNNVAQRNLQMVMMTSAPIHSSGFMAGNEEMDDEEVDVVLTSGRLARDGEVVLCFDRAATGSGAPGSVKQRPTSEGSCGGIVFLEPTRIETCFGECRAVLTLGKGSRLDPLVGVPAFVRVDGGEMAQDGEGTCVRLTRDVAVVRLRKPAFQRVPLAVRVSLPANATQGEAFDVNIAQRNLAGRIVGGAVITFVADGT